MKILLRKLPDALLLCVILAAGELCFAGTTGILEGVVRDKRTGEPLPGVTVFLPAARLGAATDTAGAFSIQNIRAGSYEVRITHVGFRTTALRDVIIQPDLRTRVTVKMEPVDVLLDEIVVVQGKPLIQTDVTGTAFMVSDRQLQALPVTEPLDVMRLKPGITVEGSIRGGKPTEVAYLVDGLPIQDLVRGGVTSTLPLSSVVGLSLYTGGFDAEYGNALSGVVNLVTRQGGNEHQAFARAGSDQIFTGSQTSKTREAEFSLAGPLVPEKLFYVAALSGSLSDTRWWQDLSLFFPSPIEKSLNGFGKVDYLVTQDVRVGAQVLYSTRTWRDYEFSWRYDLNGLPPENRSSDRTAIILSDAVSPRFFYTASLSRYHVATHIGENRATVANLPLYEYDFFLRYVVNGSRPLWLDNHQEDYTLKMDGTLQTLGNHLFKFGFDVTQHDLRADIVKLEPQRTYFGKPLVNEPPLDFSTTYSYRPRSASAYVQDKIDLLDNGLLVNVGLRYDLLDPRASRPALEATLTGDTALVHGTGITRGASAKQQLSPRIGAAMPVADKGYVFLNLGWYFQYPLFDYLYTGLDRVGLTRGVSALTGNPDLEPERSLSLELNFKYILPHDLVLSLSYFKRESTNLVDTKTFVSGNSRVAGDFGFAEFVNSPYANAAGIELVLTREKGEWITGEVSYTYLSTEGESGGAYDGFYIVQYGLPPIRAPYPLSWDQAHTFKGLVNLALPADFDVSIAGQWHSGRPYTNYPTSTGFEAVRPDIFATNNARMPSFALLDLKVEKHLTLSEAPLSRLTIFIDVRNLTNQANVSWMDSNGRIGGELADPSGYSIGRRTKLGVQWVL
jgi:hypothetical protein